MNTVGRGMLIASAAATLVLAGNVVARATDKTASEVHCARHWLAMHTLPLGHCAGSHLSWHTPLASK